MGHQVHPSAGQQGHRAGQRGALGRETQVTVVGISWADISHLEVSHSCGPRVGLGDGKWGLMQREVSKRRDMMCTGCIYPSPWIGEDQAGCLLLSVL